MKGQIAFLNNGMVFLMLENDYGVRYIHEYEGYLDQMLKDIAEFKSDPNYLGHWEGNDDDNEDLWDVDFDDDPSWVVVDIDERGIDPDRSNGETMDDYLISIGGEN